MSRNNRDLLNAGLYLVAVFLLFTALAGGASVAGRVVPDAFAAAIEPMFDDERAPTRLSAMTASARQIRAALDQPIPPPARLSPITAKVAFGHLKDGTASATRVVKKRLPAEALDAMASAGPPVAGSRTTWTGSAAVPLADKHKVY